MKGSWEIGKREMVTRNGIRRSCAVLGVRLRCASARQVLLRRGYRGQAGVAAALPLTPELFAVHLHKLLVEPPVNFRRMPGQNIFFHFILVQLDHRPFG